MDAPNNFNIFLYDLNDYLFIINSTAALFFWGPVRTLLVVPRAD